LFKTNCNEKIVLKNDVLTYMPIIIEGFRDHEVITYLAGVHPCNNCFKPMTQKCHKCMGVGYCSNKCRRADTTHEAVCASIKDKKLPKLRALFINTMYALMEDQPDHELFHLNNRYYHVIWDKTRVSEWTLVPITAHQFVSSVSLQTIKNCHRATRVFVGTEIGVLSMG